MREREGGCHINTKPEYFTVWSGAGIIIIITYNTKNALQQQKLFYLTKRRRERVVND